MEFCEVLKRVQEICHLEYAEEWDNVGLLVQPFSLFENGGKKHISKVMLCIDLTIPALEEAKEKGVQLIISYHPVLFKSIKALTPQSGVKQRIICECLERGIAVFCPHSALDSLPEHGMNDYLASPFKTKKGSSCVPIQRVKLPLDQNAGPGRIVTLETELTLSEVIETIKPQIKGHIRVAQSHINVAKKVKTLAFCVGSGTDLLSKVKNADVLICGEMSHHAVLDAVEKGISVIMSEHTSTERGYLDGCFMNLLKSSLGTNIDIFVSSQETELISLA